MLYENLSINENGVLTLAGQDTVALAAEYGTPLMLLDADRIRSRCREYKKAMAEHLPAGSMPFYASKALSFKRLYNLIDQEGLGVDVVSGGELYTALAAGFPPEKMCFHGSSKTDGDIIYGIENKVGTYRKSVDATGLFKDDADISRFAREAVYDLKSRGIIKGDKLGNLHPREWMSREEVAVVISRVLKEIEK